MSNINYGIKFDGFKAVFVDQARVLSRYEKKAVNALGRVGAILRQEARKTIKRRVVTAGMWDRYHAARARKDYRGAYKIAQTIDARKSATSAPGDAPFAHVPDNPVASLRAIYYAVTTNQKKQVSVGPVKANQVVNSWIKNSRTTAAEALEFGDLLTLLEWRFTNLAARNSRWDRFRSSGNFQANWTRQDQRWLNVSRKRGRLALSDLGLETRQRRVRLQARPFMGPTLTRSQQAIRSVLASAFAGGGA